MARERTDSERLVDNALLTYLWSRAQQRDEHQTAGDRLKLTKLAFLATYPLYRDQTKALNLRFYRYTYGPYSVQLNDNWADLTAREMMTEDEVFQVTDEGMRLAQSFGEDVLDTPENRPIRAILDAVADENGPLSTEQLLRKVYDMHCYVVGSPGRRQRVKAVPMYQDFTNILDDEEAEKAILVPHSWDTTLELAFDPSALRNLQRGIEDTHAGRVHGWEVFGALV